MKLIKTLSGLALAGLLSVVMGAQTANAQNFTFTSVYADNTITSGTSTVLITNGASVGADGTPTAIVLGNLSEFTTPTTGPNTFTNSPYSLTLTLTDVGSGMSHSGIFSGLLNGTADGGVGGNAPSSIFTDTPTNNTLNFAFASGTYTVTRNGFVSPGPSGVADGSMGALVKFTPEGATVPEPSSAAIFGIGICGLAAVMFARRRKIIVA